MFDPDTQSAIAKIAKRLDVPSEALLAVAEVESGGRVVATVNDRDEPLIRFEGHYFDRFLRGDQRDLARELRLASPVPGRIKNPRNQAGRWKMLHRAIAINRVAAMSSCSWGLGQVMGAHWQWLGYGSVDALVAEARLGVAGQVALMARYIDRAKLAEALRQQDWAKFARVYNGPAYAKNRYDEKMAAAHARFKGASKSATLPEPTNAEDADVLKFGARGKDVARLQKSLTRLGYVLVADGLFGLVTDRVVRQFQRDHLLDETGIVGDVERQIVSGGSSRMAASLTDRARKLRETAKKGVALSGKKAGGLLANLRARLLSISDRFA